MAKPVNQGVALSHFEQSQGDTEVDADVGAQQLHKLSASRALVNLLRSSMNDAGRAFNFVLAVPASV